MHLGWKRDLPDHRDLYRLAPPPHTLPDKVDLRNGMPEVWNQQTLGSCSAHAVAAAFEYDRIKQRESKFTPSRLFIYYNERQLEGTIPYDSGAMLRDGIKTLVAQGACDETLWPYDVSRFADTPTIGCYDAALKYKAIHYERVAQTAASMEECLASGIPFAFGVTVYPSFESQMTAQTGMVRMPNSDDDSPLGGHALCACGYNRKEQVFIFRNSWGFDWGEQGYGFIPYAYLINPNLAADFWAISSVS